MENHYSLLSQETLKKFRKARISEMCVNNVFSEAIAKKAKKIEHIHVREDGRMGHTKYEFAYSCPKEEEAMDEIDDLFTLAWGELCKKREAQYKEDSVEELFGNMVTNEALMEELKSLNLLGYAGKRKRNTLRLWLSFSAQCPRHGTKSFWIDIDNKDFFTLDERKDIVERMENLAIRRLFEMEEDLKSLIGYYQIKQKNKGAKNDKRTKKTA